MSRARAPHPQAITTTPAAMTPQTTSHASSTPITMSSPLATATRELHPVEGALQKFTGSSAGVAASDAVILASISLAWISLAWDIALRLAREICSTSPTFLQLIDGCCELRATPIAAHGRLLGAGIRATARRSGDPNRFARRRERLLRLLSLSPSYGHGIPT
jgi:hypothetical protein